MRKFAMALLLTSVTVTPAFANYFANPQLGISLNVGSAPIPTPKQVHDDEKPIPESQPAPETFQEFVLRAVGLWHHAESRAGTG